MVSFEIVYIFFLHTCNDLSHQIRMIIFVVHGPSEGSRDLKYAFGNSCVKLTIGLQTEAFEITLTL
jgi:hypothetical protein